MAMQRYDNALTHLKQSLEIHRNISLDERKDGNIARRRNNVGNCLLELQRYNEALNDLKQSLEIHRNISLDERKDGNVVSTLVVGLLVPKRRFFLRFFFVRFFFFC